MGFKLHFENWNTAEDVKNDLAANHPSVLALREGEATIINMAGYDWKFRDDGATFYFWFGPENGLAAFNESMFRRWVFRDEGPFWIEDAPVIAPLDWPESFVFNGWFFDLISHDLEGTAIYRRNLQEEAGFYLSHETQEAS